MTSLHVRAVEAGAQPLPPLKQYDHSSSSTVSESLSRKHELNPEMLEPWTSFATEVADSQPAFQDLILTGVPHPPPRENYPVANEFSVQARFAHNAGVVGVNPIFERLPTANRPLRRPVLGDCPATALSSLDDLEANSRRRPDFGLVRMCLPSAGPSVDSPYSSDILVVPGEAKTPWTTVNLLEDLFCKRPGDRLVAPATGIGESITHVTKVNTAEQHGMWLARRFGQLVRYMDDAKLRYGFFTNYEATVFVRRISNDLFQVSPPIMRWDNGTQAPSVRQCFLALAQWTESEFNRTWPVRIGLPLASLHNVVVAHVADCY